MDRRGFLRSAAVITAGIVATDQLELVERLGWKRRLFAGWSPILYGDGIHDDTRALQAVFDGRKVWDARRQIMLRPYTGSIEVANVPDGRFRICDTLHVPAKALRGTGHERAILDFRDAPVKFIEFEHIDVPEEWPNGVMLDA